MRCLAPATALVSFNHEDGFIVPSELSLLYAELLVYRVLPSYNDHSDPTSFMRSFVMLRRWAP